MHHADNNINMLYNDLISTRLTLYNMFIHPPNEILNSVNTFLQCPQFKAIKNENNNNLLKLKNTLKSIHAKIYMDNEYKYIYNRLMNIDDIQSLWMVYQYYSNNSQHYYLYIQHKQILFNELYIDVDKQYTELINNLGFLHRYQYDIIYNSYSLNENSIKNKYVNALCLHFNLNPQTLTFNELKKITFATIKSFITNKHKLTQHIIKKYWLLPKFTNKDLLEVNSIFANNLLNLI